MFEIEEVYHDAPVGLCILDNELRWVRINQFLADINGFPVPDHIGRTFKQLMPEVAVLYEGHMRRVLETGQPQIGFETIRTISSRPELMRRFRESWLPIRNTKAEIIGLNVVVEEITREKQLESQLLWNKKSAELLSELAARLLSSPRPRESISENCLKMMEFLDCQVFFNYLVDEDKKQLFLSTWAGIPEQLALKIQWLDYNYNTSGYHDTAWNNIESSTEGIQFLYGLRKILEKYCGIKVLVFYPLWGSNRIIGVLSFGTSTRDFFTSDEQTIMKVAANQVAAVINHIHIEEALRQSEDKYRSIIETANEGIWTLDNAGCVTFVNQRIIEMFGYDSQEMMGRCALDFFPEQMPFPRNKLFAGVMGSTNRFRGVPCRHKNGTLLWVNISCSPIYDKNGRTTGLFGMFTDVSVNKRIIEELHERTARYELVVTGTHAAIWDWDIRHKRIFFSPQWKQLRGYCENEIGDREDELCARIHPADKDHVCEKLHQHLIGLIPFFADEYRILCKNGCYKWIYDYGIAQRNKNGEAVRMVGSNTDITERKSAEKKRDKENRLIAMANSILEIFVEEGGNAMYKKVLKIILDGMDSRHGIFGYINEKGELHCPSLSRLHATEGSDNNGILFTPSEWHSLWREALLDRKCLYTNQPLFFSSRHVDIQRCLVTPVVFQNAAIGLLLVANKAVDYTADDQEFIGELTSRIAPVLYAWIQRTLREKAQLQAEKSLRASEQRYRVLAEELHDANQYKNDFLAVLSHELRNPLTPIKNSLFILDRALNDAERVRHARQIIGRQVDQLTRLVDDLLDVTRITKNKIELQCEPVELNRLIRRTVEDHHSSFEVSGVKLYCILSPEPVFIDGDGARLAQVVGNLLQNAVKFTEEGGSTTISSAVESVHQSSIRPGDDRWAVIRIADTGIGMSEEIMSRLFQPFIQADKTLDRSRGGLGLGLALSKGLIELHGGHIIACSNGPGLGSEFIIRLPLAENANQQWAVCPEQPLSIDCRKILVIDDNIDILESLQELLETEGHSVKTAWDGPSGLALGNDFLPEVVLCDIGLPGMNGYEVARALRTHPLFKKTLLIALSGYALPEDLQLAKDAGFDHHLAKPLRYSLLAQLLANLKS